MNFEKNIVIKRKLLTLNTFVHFKYFRHFFLTLSTLGTFFFCSKSSAPTEPEEQRPRIEVQGPITGDTVWESGNDYIVRGTVVGSGDRKIKSDF